MLHSWISAAGSGWYRQYIICMMDDATTEVYGFVRETGLNVGR